MKVNRQEDEQGKLETITFSAEQGETVVDFKTAVAKWIKNNTSMTWQDVFTRLVVLEGNRITIDMR